MIHPDINKSSVAKTYYLLQKGISLTPQQAVKKFIQDKNIDRVILSLVISTIIEEQKKLLKSK